MRDAAITFLGGVGILGAVAGATLLVAVLVDLWGPRRRSWLAEDGRPEPATLEDWQREADAAARRSAARRAVR